MKPGCHIPNFLLRNSRKGRIMSIKFLEYKLLILPECEGVKLRKRKNMTLTESAECMERTASVE